MARKGRIDRGLVQRTTAAGEKVWYVRLYHQGKEEWFGGFRTKTEARDFYEKAKQEQRISRFFPERYQHGGSELVATILDRHTATSTVKNQYAEKNYAKWWKARCDGQRLNHITPALLEEAKRALYDEGLAPQTVLHYMKFLRHVLNVAVRDGQLERNPFVKVTLPSVTTGRTRFLSLDEEHRLLDQLGPIYAPWARLAILTGLRLSEQFTLRWADVDLERGVITLPETKAGKVQYAHLNEEAKDILRTRQIQHMNCNVVSPWVYPSERLATPIDQRNFSTRIFRPAVMKTRLEGVGWHTLRHTFASRLAMSGQTEGTIATLLRHSGTALVARYAHLSPSHLRAAVEGVATFGNGTVTKTGISKNEEVKKTSEVIEKVGAGDGI